MKKFDIPSAYISPIISKLKMKRKLEDRMKQDFSPSELDFGPVVFYAARHFGFCYGVENAIEKIYKIITTYPDKRIFLLSEMIHNPKVNADLLDLGIQFMQDTKGNQLISWDEVTKDDIVVIPAFGTTVEIEQILKEKGIAAEEYDTTCPFVEKVWKRSLALGKDNYTIVIHGKSIHEETRATFSHALEHGQALVIQDMKEAEQLAQFITGELPIEQFSDFFPSDRYSPNFDPSKHLERVGVVNQTTMLATDTQAIADYIKGKLGERYSEKELKEYFADTRDTLCYATSDNQNAVYALLKQEADFALVIGGYNSSNTSHLVELCEEKLPTFFISSADKILDKETISHYDQHKKEELTSAIPFSKSRVSNILITSGASCPDAIVDEVIQKVLSLFPDVKTVEQVIK
ncbi:MAG: 4-hydroxy-3-methylbut-2-enyl diphosphate reductase [Cyclobacteriaceae bacterium]